MQCLTPGTRRRPSDRENGRVVERQIEEAVGALINRDQERARKVVTADMVIDAMQRA